MKVFFVFVLALIVSIQTANAKKDQCFKCGNHENKESCKKGDEADWKKLGWKKVDCKSGWCVENIFGKGKDTIIVKDCFDLDPNKNMKEDCVDIPNGIGEACYCKGNLCNGSFKTQASVVGTIMLVIVSSLLFN